MILNWFRKLVFYLFCWVWRPLKSIHYSILSVSSCRFLVGTCSIARRISPDFLNSSIICVIWSTVSTLLLAFHLTNRSSGKRAVRIPRAFALANDNGFFEPLSTIAPMMWTSSALKLVKKFSEFGDRYTRRSFAILSGMSCSVTRIGNVLECNVGISFISALWILPFGRTLVKLKKNGFEWFLLLAKLIFNCLMRFCISNAVISSSKPQSNISCESSCTLERQILKNK